MTETWKPVPGWPYEASDAGRVRRAVAANRFPAGMILRPNLKRHGYLYLTLHDARVRRTAAVHVLVAESFLGRQPRQVVNHRNGDKVDNRLCNLELTTTRGNALHAAAADLVPFGEQHGQARLTEAQAREILAARGSATSAALAARYGVSAATVSHIWTGRKWRRIHGDALVGLHR